MRKVVVIILAALMLLCSAAGAESAIGQLAELYAQAELLMVTGDYSGAAEKFDALGAYSDSSQMAMYCKAINLAETVKAYELAIDAFKKLGEFKDCPQMAVYYTARSYESYGETTLGDMKSKTDGELKNAKVFYESASDSFAGLALFKDSITRLAACQGKIQEIDDELAARAAARKEAVYTQAQEKESNGEYSEAIKLYKTISGYKDSDERVTVCETMIKKTAYDAGVEYQANGEWALAVRSFTDAGDYSDAKEKISETYYMKGMALREAKDWDGAFGAFKDAGDYSDAEEKISETYYMKGMALREAKDWNGAAKAFKDAGDYSDAKTQINETYYLYADDLEKAGKQEEAYKIFIALGDYEDSFGRANKPYYEKGAALKEAGDWDGAIEAFEHAGDYSDAKEQVSITYYMKGTALREAEDWDGAVEAFEAAGDYSDAKEQVSITYYMKGTALREAKDWDGAAKAFKDAGDYSDAKTQINETHYLHAEDLEKAGEQEEAYTIFISLGDYRDSFERANKPYYDLGMALWGKDDISGAASAFAHAGTYQDADKVILKMYYTKATADLKEHKYVDALIYYRMAGDYEDSFIKAIELEYRFRKLLVSSGHVFTALKADGSLYSATAKTDYTFSVPPFNSIVRYDRNTLGAVGITKDDKIVLTGDYAEFGVAESWKYICDVKIGVLNIFALRSDGKIQVVKKYKSDDLDLDAIQQLKNIKKIEYLDAGSVFFALDQEGNAYGADMKHTFRHFDIKLSDIFIGKSYANVYGKGLDGQVYQFSQQEMSWKKISGDWYKDFLFGEYRVTGTSSDRDILAKMDMYAITVELHKDGTLTADRRELDVDNWKLWNDQRELAEIFEWQPEEVKEKDYAGIYSQAEEALNTDEEKAYDLFASIIEYQPARDLMNSNKKLIKIRNNHFTKGGRMSLGEKNTTGKMRFTILDQRNNKILVLSDEMITMNAGKDVNYKKEFKTSRLYGYVTGLYDNMFSEKEQKAVLPVDNGMFKGEKVFMLSRQEVMKYFPKAPSRARGGNWCTCTVHQKYAGCLEVFDRTGELTYTGASTSEKSFPIALWLSLDELPLPAEE